MFHFTLMRARVHCWLERWNEPLLAGVLLFLWLKNAWASDDAYIYFRSVEMWYAGYGPVYNPGWRVQVFTSPLWYALLVWARAFIPDVYLAAQVLSLGLSVVVWWLLRRRARGPAMRWFTALALAASIGFFEYTSSGLEMPLVYALLLLLLSAWENERPWQVITLFPWLVLARYDVAFFLAGPVVVEAALAAWKEASSQGAFVRGVLLRFLPLFLWGLWATFYYGTPLPNPVYAKVFAGIPRWMWLKQGVLYYLAHLRLDPWTLLASILGMVAWFRLPRGRVWAWSLMLYGAYLLFIGGDFMLGRFLAPAFLVAWVGLLRRGFRVHGWMGVGLIAYAWLISAPLVQSPWHDVSNRGSVYGVTDERGWYAKATSLLMYGFYHLQGEPYPFFPTYGWSRQGYIVRFSPIRVAVTKSVGMFGYWAGSEKTVVDVWALVDPFLARLPDADGQVERPGHLTRKVPLGYIQTLVTRKNHLETPHHRALWETVALVTQGPLWSWERIRAIPVYALPYLGP